MFDAGSFTELLEQHRDAAPEPPSRRVPEIDPRLGRGILQALNEDPHQVADHLARAKGLARESLQEARRTVWGLLPQALEQMALELDFGYPN